MHKNTIIVVLAILVVALLVYLFWPSLTQAPVAETNTETPTENEETTICAQVITPAVNPDTGEIREFPTPCDVPEGWEVIENDIPGLELQVQ
ncbi:MAG: hypothetical protein AAB955_02800 [Patescibacteria group bacterium]